MEEIWCMGSTGLFVIEESACHVSHLFLFQYRLGVGLKLGHSRAIFRKLTKLWALRKTFEGYKHNHPNLAREYADMLGPCTIDLFLETY